MLLKPDTIIRTLLTFNEKGIKNWAEITFVHSYVDELDSRIIQELYTQIEHEHAFEEETIVGET